LIDVGSTLYGTTEGGGTSNNGTVFGVTTSGEEHVLHGFKGGSDGALAEAGLIDVGGTLYGTTENGRANDAGTVFAITTSGKEHVLYSFKGGSDGGDTGSGTDRRRRHPLWYD
jgi:uncharacterized repeat protein (TIGR03803 family)